MVGYRFNPPPGWPEPPPGWRPPQGWQPDPAWPAAPADWEFWVPQDVPPQPPERRSGGLFGGRRRLAEENALLRAWVERLGGMDAIRIAELTGGLRDEYERLCAALDDVTRRLREAERRIVWTEETALLQEVGVYEYRHPLSDVVAYEERLAQVRARIKEMAKEGRAVVGATGRQANGSAAEGRKMARDFSTLMARAYNAEADNCVRTMRPYTLQSAIERLEKSVDTIVRLGRTMSIHVNPEYHRTRIYELQLTADHLAKQEEEKELVRAQRERQREEEAARREFEREKARLREEEAHCRAALAGPAQDGAASREGVAELEVRLEELAAAVAAVEAREADTRAGYVYVVSNMGAFGEDVVKIGMTRRLEPEDRVRELGGASVPFRFDTHALIFSEDAVELEARLHAALDDRRLNKVDLRREFFRATPAEVRDLLREIAGQHLLEYRDTAEALEWRQSAGMT
ncbi:DUF4041 domain-containing protein [Nonomuraea mesophila]|uniref:DUF4041 domain-containing protein n=1 Tax=Nonomuraea mesophila TaxID=2530382 RepID=A0A4R5FYX4_9ACTN|nr:DUF4041 domain-containing protein [Nonomuraea mesophila]TDE60449.1 DUF4041 domain-containing protein [Nonomuraea mesophila]